MSIPNEALQKVSHLPAMRTYMRVQASDVLERSKLAREIETQAAQSQQQINMVKTQMAAKQRDVRLLELTANEVGGLPKDTNVYEGVGQLCLPRFVFSPTGDVKSKLSTEASELKADISNLEKKLHYLETTHKNSQAHIEKLFNSGIKA
ncbi:MAG: hypothetical protein M1833_007163 [Piccolia ochrophora]|nr:MAG: hypothetical protein M1833_007163 [Piccolia ochrophora]